MPMETAVAAGWLAWGLWDLPEDGLDFQQLKTAHASARAVYEDFMAQAVALRASGRYSAAGLAQELRTLAEGHLERLGEVETNLIAPRRARLAALREHLDPPRTYTASEAFRSQEIRSFILGLNREDRLVELRAAVQEGDRESLEAVTEAPFLLRRALGLDPRLIKEFRERLFAARVDPEALAAWKQLARAIELAEQALATAEARIRKEAGLSPVSPTMGDDSLPPREPHEPIPAETSAVEPTASE